MEAALLCAQCGTLATGQRFCTTCGAASAGTDAGVDPPLSEDIASPVLTDTAFGAPPIADTASSPVVPWLTGEPGAASPRSRPNIVALCVVAALVLSGWAIWRGVEEHTLSGTVLLVDSMYFGARPGSRCTGENGYGDLGAGAQVVLTDDRGTTLSTGRLSDGEFDGLGCVFSFALEDVTRADFYRLEIAGGSRGQLQYSYDELADGDWSLQLSLGDD
jgi:hypothetical protein